jgi:two-component system KDP operon response regulator KdpE
MEAGAVLVVDDDPAMLKFVRLALEGVGFQVHGALHFAAALEVLSNDSLEIGVAVIDYELPGSRLADLLGEIRSNRRVIRSIVTSGYSLDFLEEAEGSLPAGVEFLKKPFLPRELVAAVRRAFTRPGGAGASPAAG